MKQRICLFVLLCLSAFSTAYADSNLTSPHASEGRKITIEQALERVKQDFSGQDVDYYGKSDFEMDSHTIFVDLAPLK